MTNEQKPTAATESEGAELHREFCKFLLGVLTAKEKTEDGVEVSTCTPAWGAVIRAFLKDNSITTVPDAEGDSPMAELTRKFRAGSPPRLSPDLDLDVH